MKKIFFLLILCSFTIKAKETTIQEKKDWAKKTCESFKIYGESCRIEQLDYAPKWKSFLKKT